MDVRPVYLVGSKPESPSRRRFLWLIAAGAGSGLAGLGLHTISRPARARSTQGPAATEAHVWARELAVADDRVLFDAGLAFLVVAVTHPDDEVLGRGADRLIGIVIDGVVGEPDARRRLAAAMSRSFDAWLAPRCESSVMATLRRLGDA